MTGQNHTPILILAYNRPDQVRGLIESLRPHKPQKIFVAVDGPKNSKADLAKVQSVIQELDAIDWTADIRRLIRKSNLGLRFAVPDAVNWVLCENDRLIVLEDDVRVGADFFYFMNFTLERFREDPRVGHVSGYNLVPEAEISNSQDLCRESIYPESYAWGTWSEKWQSYSDPIPKLSFRFLTRLTGSIWSALAWRINFRNARRNNVSTWAYRWVAGVWKNGLISVSPNRNISTYVGQTGGTHTRTKPRWVELPLGEIKGLKQNAVLAPDLEADSWMAKNIFRGSLFGALISLVESMILEVIRPWRHKNILREDLGP